MPRCRTERSITLTNVHVVYYGRKKLGQANKEGKRKYRFIPDDGLRHTFKRLEFGWLYELRMVFENELEGKSYEEI